MRVLTNHEAAEITDPALRRLAYNALDCCITRGVAAELLPKVEADDKVARVYRAERAIQAAAIAVQMRGIRIDEEARTFGIAALKRTIRRIEEVMERALGRHVNPRSPQQLKALLYDEWGISPIRDKEGKITTGIEALEKIRDGKAKWISRLAKREREATARLVARCVLRVRDLGKQKAVLASPLHHGRMRCTLSTGSTDTFRFSSHRGHMGDGTNLQNITKRRRYIFIPDPGFVMVQMDQAQAESRVVAFASGDEGYIAAHEASDTHTYVARLVWPDAGWTGDDARDREFAEEPGFLRHFSRRDLAKKTQHALNYGGTEHMLSRDLRITLAEGRGLKRRYFEAFPGISEWQESIIKEVREHGVLHYPGGYKRQFFDRPWDDATHRKAIASLPQSIVAWTNHIAFWRVWRELDGPDLKVLLHVHDAILLQIKEDKVDELLPRAQALASTPWPMPSGVMTIPWDTKVGANWKAVS